MLNKVKKGITLTAVEHDDVLSCIKNPKEQVDLYTLLHVLWINRDKADSIYFYPYVSPQDTWELRCDDDMIRRICLQALVDISPDYKTYKILCQHLDNDDSTMVKMITLSGIGELGAQNNKLHHETAYRLIDVFNKNNIGSVVCDSAYEGMLNLLKIPFNSRPNAARPLSVNDIDASVIAKVNEMVIKL